RYSVAYATALALGFACVALPWSLRLGSNFGNPFFPRVNGVFRSPEFTTEPLRHLRFVPSSLGEFLWRPFAMVDPVYMVHEELRAPDLRYALLLCLICVLVAQRLRRHLARPTVPGAAASPLNTRVLAALGLGLTIDWIAWLSVSGNSRYF